MNKKLKLMCILAHPDDESMGTGGILAKYAAEGVETYLVTATRGERGWFGASEDYPGEQALGQIREAELLEAAEVLGLKEVNFLDYCDGEMENASFDEVIGKIVPHIRRVKPDVVVTMDQFGVYGHPDHIAMCQYATAAVMAAANIGYKPAEQDLPSHQVSKMYYMALTQATLEAFEVGFGELAMEVKGESRPAFKWHDWAVTARIDATAYSARVWDAVACHRSQVPAYGVLKDLPEHEHGMMWGNQSYYRVFSLVNGGSRQETDLFEGLREAEQHQEIASQLIAAD